MRPTATVAAIVARERLRYFFLPTSERRGYDLYRRYAFAALGPTRARRLLHKVRSDVGGRPDGTKHRPTQV